MYSIHNLVKDEVPTHLVEEKSTELICMFDDIPFMNESPEYNHHNGNYMIKIDIDGPKQPALPSWEEEAQFYQ